MSRRVFGGVLRLPFGRRTFRRWNFRCKNSALIENFVFKALRSACLAFEFFARDRGDGKM